MDKIFSDIKNSVGNAVKKSGDLVEITKVKLSLGDTRSEIHVKFQELGERVYRAYKANETADTQELLWELDELAEVYQNLEKKLAGLRKEKICANCGKACDADDAYCRACGARFEEEAEEEPEEAEANMKMDDTVETVE